MLAEASMSDTQEVCSTPDRCTAPMHAVSEQHTVTGAVTLLMKIYGRRKKQCNADHMVLSTSA